MFSKVLIANRGTIACRIIRTLRKMGVGSVAVYSEADRHSLHVAQADEAVLIGPALAAHSYLSVDTILDAANKTGAQAIHPGYGFLSENAEFARACKARGIAFVGPTAEQIEAFALKHTARSIAQKCGVPLLPGTGLLSDVEEAVQRGELLGFPVMLKSSGGGGGIGMRVCQSVNELREAYDAVLRLSRANFGDSGVYLEKFVTRAKHIEVQIFGDGQGGLIALGERDCSAQRRHQKVIEETPVPGLVPETRAQLFQSAILLGKAVQYASAGTVEFIYDDDSKEFYFLEVNTRLQVEHGVTEQVTGIDLVEWMVRQAAGELRDIEHLQIPPHGSSIEARIYAEDPAQNFRPTPGRLLHVAFPPAELARIETSIESGSEVTPFYDPMIAKIIVTGADRKEAVSKLQTALDACSLYGIETNVRYLRQLSHSPEFTAGAITTSFLSHFDYQRNALEVIEGGTQTTIQDYPGRIGYWHVGVPPSGPMDALAFRLANRLVGNPESAAAIEFSTLGSRLRFHSDTVFALTGADMGAKLDGVPVARWRTIPAKAGAVLQLGAARSGGCRACLAVRGGFDVYEYLGSRSTFMLGGFGGHGRALRAGDIVHFNQSSATDISHELPTSLVPQYTNRWEIGVLFGPHTSPDFFTPADIEMLFATDWKVHYQSDRTGVRLIGPKPVWARPDGGEAGLHPSNIHDNAYAVGTIDFTGDMPILLGPDGPSLGGFVCPATVVQAELWKLGQLKAGDIVRFRRISFADAEQMENALENCISDLSGTLPSLPTRQQEPSILRAHPHRKPSITHRADGDKYLLVEYGENKLDLALRFRVHLLEQRLREEKLAGIVDITPGVRSLHIHYDNRQLPRESLLDALDSFDATMPDLSNVTVPSRIVHMPLSWDDPAVRLAQQKYMQAVRPDAPWCPSNIEFIRRVNGLSSIDDVYRIAFEASYLVLGLGDVYLGAPVATPIDPRHRLVTTKYNPARTWTPENAVGIGGAYLCVYGMEGPGGYQLIGRTVQVWNTFKTTKSFLPGFPWSLRFFDQIRFYPVSAEELLALRDAFPHGGFELKVENTDFNLKQYQTFLDSIQAEAASFKSHQKGAFDAERERWKVAGQAVIIEPPEAPLEEVVDEQLPEGYEAATSPITANVFQIAVEPGQTVEAGQKLVVLDAMKTELVVTASSAGRVREIRCATGKIVNPGQQLVVLQVQ